MRDFQENECYWFNLEDKDPFLGIVLDDQVEHDAIHVYIGEGSITMGVPVNAEHVPTFDVPHIVDMSQPCYDCGNSRKVDEDGFRNVLLHGTGCKYVMALDLIAELDNEEAY